jgi:hypothetical protein
MLESLATHPARDNAHRGACHALPACNAGPARATRPLVAKSRVRRSTAWRRIAGLRLPGVRQATEHDTPGGTADDAVRLADRSDHPQKRDCLMEALVLAAAVALA